LDLFAMRLKELRIESGLSQQELADALNVSKAIISYYESSKREPGFTVIIKLSKIFNVNTAYLMGETERR
jgi:transcriptional regulator with XRE-family HTH domain